MKILITGVAGFLGTHLAEHYVKKGWEVIGIDNLTDFELSRAKFNIKKSREHNLKFLDSIGVRFFQEDIRAIGPYSECFNDGGPDFIINCAAQPAMTIAIEHPYYDMDNNIAGVVNLLEIARHFKTPFVTCSTIHVYGNKLNSEVIEFQDRFEASPNEIDESRPILVGDCTPLHVSKYVTELYCRTYAETYGIRAAAFRLTGMYGERQFGGMDHGWVANFAIRTVMDRDITVFGTDKQVRDILYASDAAKAFDMWFENNGKSEVYNIGGGYKNSISLKECLQELKNITQKDQKIIIEPKRFGDLWYFVCDYKKAKKDFGWEPQISVDEGIKKIVGWIDSNQELFK